MRQLKFIFQEPSLIEAIAIDPDLPKPSKGLNTPGYRSLWVADLMVDYDPRTNQPYAFMISSFDKTPIDHLGIETLHGERKICRPPSAVKVRATR